MKVSIDGGVTYIDAPEGVRIAVNGLMQVDNKGEWHDAQLSIVVTDEGVITDSWLEDSDSEPVHNTGTRSETFVEIIESLED